MKAKDPLSWGPEPSPRRRLTEGEVDRATVLAEAQLLVQELDRYLELISEWVMEGPDD